MVVGRQMKMKPEQDPLVRNGIILLGKRIGQSALPERVGVKGFDEKAALVFLHSGLYLKAAGNGRRQEIHGYLSRKKSAVTSAM